MHAAGVAGDRIADLVVAADAAARGAAATTGAAVRDRRLCARTCFAEIAPTETDVSFATMVALDGMPAVTEAKKHVGTSNAEIAPTEPAASFHTEKKIELLLSMCPLISSVPQRVDYFPFETE